jgi:hypothetical protein
MKFFLHPASFRRRDAFTLPVEQRRRLSFDSGAP